MEEINLKSAKDFLKQLISTFELTDFAPMIEPEKLQSKFKDKLNETNAYWSIFNAPSSWGKWIFIEIKSFKPWESLRIGFLFGKRDLVVVIFEELNGTNFSGEKLQKEISLVKAWLDHEYLFDSLWEIFKQALYYANRPNADDKFPNQSIS